MGKKLYRSITLLGSYLLAHPQFMLTLALIVVIPVVFLYTGQQFLNVASDNQERLEKDKIGLMHDVFVQLILSSTDNVAHLQSQIQTIAEQNRDITKFRVVKETPEGLQIIAALREPVIGSYEKETELYTFSSLEKDDSLIFEYFQDDTRFWQTFRSVKTPVGETYFVFTETTFAATDQLFKVRIQEAYLWLFFLLCIVLFLAYRHLKLIDYGYLYREANEAITTRDLFTNMVTHELRAPLTAMRGYASMIHENDKVDFAVREQALRIEQSSSRLLLIVNDLLEVARLQSGKLTIEKTDTKVADTIAAVLSGLESSALEKSITLSRDVADPSLHIRTDEKRLHQVLTNLVSNAIKYTESGSITIVLKDDGKNVQIRVQDTGMGISSDDQKKLFAPFFRVQSKDVSKITGSGLGMWITKQLVDLLGANIGVESIKDVGTHVVLTLPKE